jgi:hypothetical protein
MRKYNNECNNKCNLQFYYKFYFVELLEIQFSDCDKQNVFEKLRITLEYIAGLAYNLHSFS